MGIVGWIGGGIRMLRALFRNNPKDLQPLAPFEPAILIDNDSDALNDPVRLVFYNDDRTTAVFVVLVLMKCFSMTKKEAIDIALKAHVEKQYELKFLSRENANRAIDYIKKEAAQREYPFCCEIRSL